MKKPRLLCLPGLFSMIIQWFGDFKRFEGVFSRSGAVGRK